MRVWPAFLAPLVALLDQSVAYALVPWACATQNAHAIDGVHLFFLATIVLATLPAWADARRYRATLTPNDAGEAGGRPRMMSVVSALAGALSALVIVALWAPQWFLSPCFA
jgi:hypothetical protein